LKVGNKWMKNCEKYRGHQMHSLQLAVGASS